VPEPAGPRDEGFTPFELRPSHGSDERSSAACLEQVRDSVAELKDRLISSGVPSGVTSGRLVTRPYPTAFAFAGAPRSPVTTVPLTSRLLVVQWRDPAGTVRTLLWEPADHDRTLPIPDPAGVRRRSPLRTVVHGTVPGHLRALGLAAEDVDYVAFSSLQTHDLRRLLGTTTPATDLGGADAPVSGWLPAARLLVDRREWETALEPHPLQRPWYQPATTAQLPTERVVALDGDVLLGPGVALLSTPGRTCGHRSLALHTDNGVWVASSNGAAAEAWAPHASRIPGLRAWSMAWDRETVPHDNGAVSALEQYDAMVLERLLADQAPGTPFPQCLPAAELTPHRLAVGLAPTHVHAGLAHGAVLGTPPAAVR
jgi:hypothetical protein